MRLSRDLVGPVPDDLSVPTPPLDPKGHKKDQDRRGPCTLGSSRLASQGLVVSAFQINEDIVLPSLCPSLVHPLEKALHKLDVVRAIRIYLSRTASFRQADPLFIVSEGRRKGLPASKSTIARWIRSAVLEAYRVQSKRPPSGVKAHSTRAVGASWAVRHQASASQVPNDDEKEKKPLRRVNHSPQPSTTRHRENKENSRKRSTSDRESTSVTSFRSGGQEQRPDVDTTSGRLSGSKVQSTKNARKKMQRWKKQGLQGPRQEQVSIRGGERFAIFTCSSFRSRDDRKKDDRSRKREHERPLPRRDSYRDRYNRRRGRSRSYSRSRSRSWSKERQRDRDRDRSRSRSRSRSRDKDLGKPKYSLERSEPSDYQTSSSVSSVPHIGAAHYPVPTLSSTITVITPSHHGNNSSENWPEFHEDQVDHSSFGRPPIPKKRCRDYDGIVFYL
ncbi:unnamed protein product [Ranitomeya imitator]|uniref:Uncharacterized protein n=1 Tax=Ranitomeya imitator TaxID=111125 RepID=A0ABN9LNZ8_9NEOB|nr:unnamed protein product [Ranitomeya imitator]